ncbi:MAG: four helix bundle protein [Candidatus Omnitrophica bacterium]|nr:four helix bundle protein [Candidatus Omnitrophota bacterium]
MMTSESELTSEMEIGGFEDLESYKISMTLAGQIFKCVRKFPDYERHTLFSQTLNSSRRVSAHIAEGWAKRRRETVLRRHLRDACGAANHVLVCLGLALNCGYIEKTEYDQLTRGYQELSKRIHRLHENYCIYSQLHSDWKGALTH